MITGNRQTFAQRRWQANALASRSDTRPQAQTPSDRRFEGFLTILWWATMAVIAAEAVAIVWLLVE